MVPLLSWVATWSRPRAARADADQVTSVRYDGKKLQCRPLCVACINGHPQCVRLLLSEGLSRKTMDKALTHAKHSECARLVRLALDPDDDTEDGPSADADDASAIKVDLSGVSTVPC